MRADDDGTAGGSQKDPGVAALRSYVGKMRSSIDICCHDRQWLMRAVFAFAEALDGVRVPCIAYKMEASKPLYSGDAAFAKLAKQQQDSLIPCRFCAMDAVADKPEGESASCKGSGCEIRSGRVRSLKPKHGAAFGAGIRLGMEAPVAWRMIFVAAAFAEGEACHGGDRPVIWDRRGDGVARTTVGAVGKGIAKSTVAGVRHIRKAMGARGDIGTDKHGMPPMRSFRTEKYLEFPLIGDDICIVLDDGGDPGQRRQPLAEGRERCQCRRGALHFYANTLRGILNGACESKALCLAKDERPETDALDLTADNVDDPSKFFHTLCHHWCCLLTINIYQADIKIKSLKRKIFLE